MRRQVTDVQPPAPLRAVLLGLLLMALTGCELVDEGVEVDPDASETAVAAEDPLGSPEDDFPSTLAGLVATALPEAQAWQDEPVLVDATVWLDPDGTCTQVRSTWVAAEADRFLTVRATPDRLRVERPLLEGLQLQELSDEAVTAIPALPADVLEPVALGEAAASALADCDAADRTVMAVVYATGAPAAWDGTEWTTVPRWQATVVTSSTGVAVAPTSGQAFAPLTCVMPLLPEE